MPRGLMTHRGRPVDLAAIRRPALMTVEGEKDDITGTGQCRAALDLCTGIPAEHKLHFECPKVGHYGVFNGSRFRAEIAPRIAQVHARARSLLRRGPDASPSWSTWRRCRARPARATELEALAFSFAAR